MLNLIANQYDKPNRLEYPNKNNSPEYHAQYAKYCISQSGIVSQDAFVQKTKINKDFYKGKQWVDDEDLEAFLKDDTGQTKNRIKVVNNVIRPIIEQYRGNAIRLIINAAARSISTKAINRRETALAEKLFYTKLANEVPSFTEYIRKRYTVGANDDETKQIFDNLYVDTYSEKVTMLIRYIAMINKFEDLQVKAAENLAFSGLVVGEGYEFAGHMKWKILESERFFWDRAARMADLTDADFMGKWDDYNPSDLYEQYQDISVENRKAIENYVSVMSRNFDTEHVGLLSPKVPAFRTFWRDIEKYEYGYVKDEFGYPYLTKINYVAPGEDKPKYTDADLIDPIDTPRARKLFKGKKKRNMVVDVLRFCDLIPSDILQISNQDSNQKIPDIVLDYGIYEYQDSNWENPANISFPFKCNCWAYVDGEVLSPVDDAISPQRMINRVMSVTESQINNSGGSNVIIDESTLGPDGISQAYRDINQGKPVTINTRGRGVPNSFGVYDATPKNGTYSLFELISGLRDTVNNMTGVNEALRGESIGQDQLVGVTAMLMQRGSLIQEPFYYALNNVFMQMYQYSSSTGKMIYINNERELSIMIGDDGVETLKLSKDMLDEDFRVFIKKENVDEMLIAQADQMLFLLLQNQLIDDKIFANLYGRSTPSEVGRFLRQYSKEKTEKARLQVQQQAAQNKQLMATAEVQDQKIRAEGDRQKLQDHAMAIDLEDKKNENKMREIFAQSVNKNSAGV